MRAVSVLSWYIWNKIQIYGEKMNKYKQQQTDHKFCIRAHRHVPYRKPHDFRMFSTCTVSQRVHGGQPRKIREETREHVIH